jgi:UDP-N-acetylglucosamine--N-acetylmuramyl-(pentapeptide) pyrophosphoryl-undecaprenol N-acetylglucosamine transferase
MTLPAGCALVLHEQNSIAGLANRVLAKIARRTLVAFPDALPHAEWTGNPIRAELSALPTPAQRYGQRTGPLRLLVVGGSLGAVALNEAVPKALALLPAATRPVVVHQAGAKQIAALEANYREAGLLDDPVHAIELLPFIDDMAQAYAQADLVICRAGAMTIAEVAAVGVAALFVPFPYAVDDHQSANAAFLTEHHAALAIQQRDLSVEKLADWLGAQTRDSLLELAVRARALAKPNATARVADVCAALADARLPHRVQGHS